MSGREFSIISSVSRVVVFSVFFVVDEVVEVEVVVDEAEVVVVVKLISVTKASSGSSVWDSGFLSSDEFLLKISMALSKASTI